LPRASRAVTVIGCVAFESAADGVKLQAPDPFAVAVPSSVVPSYTLTVEFASAVPLMVGVVFDVMVSSVDPVFDAVFRVGAAGVAGAMVSTVRFTVVEVAVLPAASVATALSVRRPSAKVDVATDQLPSALAVVVATVTVPFFTTTDALASAVPLIVGVALAVALPVVGDVIATVVAVSTIMVREADDTDVFPAASVAIAPTACGPTPSAVPRAMVQLPDASAVVVPSRVAPS
jgi:hypothetical protein